MPHRSSRRLVTAGILCGLSLSALEISVVGTAAPKIARDIGGLDSYSWIFAIYLLTATLSMPLWGRVADQIGRKKPFLASLGVFLIGATLCGLAQNMPQLIAFRAIKGLGAGGIFPIAFTIVADVYPYEERSKVQGLLSSVWGIASVIGPFIGGGLTETFGWRSIFFINLIPGAMALAVMSRHYRDSYNNEAPETPDTQTHKMHLSIPSVISSSVAVTALLLAMNFIQKNGIFGGTICAAIAVFAAVVFIWSENHATAPLVPRALLSNRIFTISALTGFFSSMMVIGLSSFGPLLFQNVLGYAPTTSGLLLVPFTLAWVIGSIISTRLMMRLHYRDLLLFGTGATLAGFCAFMALFNQLNTALICATTIVMGLGMSFNYPVALITVQRNVAADQVAFATSGISWIRNMGTTIGTAIMGVTLNLGLAYGLDLRAALFRVFCVKFAAVAVAALLSLLFPKALSTVNREAVLTHQ